MKICDELFEATSEENAFFKHWNFELSDFQKWSIRALLNKKHSLITAHTGSGKTVPAEAAIIHFTSLGQRVIYTSPIKALTNQKFNEFTKKFPNITFGILTGDNKYNPDAQVLLMTAEIFRNTLFQKSMENITENLNSQLSFEIDIDNELGCVIIDEAHYINDKERGRIWEEKIILTPPKIPLLLLSATLSRPEDFATFIERRGGPEVFICPTKKRVVPLTHYGFITVPNSNINNLTADERSNHLNSFNTLITLKESDNKGGDFKDKNYEKIRKTLKFIKKKKFFIHKYFALNVLINKLKNDDLLPAIVFVFSRKQVDILATKIEHSLHDNDSKLPSIVEKECEKLLRGKLSNWKEYIQLPEYLTIIRLLQKGIAVHHAGILKEFREMIELLFDKGYIKLLFATETFAVGINMPTRTTVFTSLEKFDGNGFRLLEPSEYTQMAGRAGRRGIDTRGVVIHANNLFNDDISTQDYRYILTGPPKSVTSKFTIHPNLILHIISTGNTDFKKFIEKSMITKELNYDMNYIKTEISDLKKKNVNPSFKTKNEILIKIHELKKTIPLLKPKQKKRVERECELIFDAEYSAKDDYSKYCSMLESNNDIKQLENKLQQTEDWIDTTCNNQIELLQTIGFIDDMTITNMGKYAICFQEVFSFPFAEAINNQIFKNLDAIEIAAVLSCFTNIKLTDENTVYSIDSINISDNTKKTLYEIDTLYDKYIDIFNSHKIENIEYIEKHLNLCEIIYNWCSAENDIDCKYILEECKKYGISLGDFVKSALKINNISLEIEKAAILAEDLELINKLKKWYNSS